MRTVDFPSGLCAGRALSGHVAFKNYCAMEDISSEREVEMFVFVVFESQGLHFGEFVDRCNNCRC